MKKVFSIWSWTMLLVLCVGVSSCSRDEEGGSSGGSSNPLIGKWSFPESDHNGSYTAYWTFNNDETMLVEDRRDAFNGHTIPYSYNAETKKLTCGGFFVCYLIWNSSREFQIQNYREKTVTFTKVN